MSVRPGEIDFEKVKEQLDMKEGDIDMQLEKFTASSLGTGVFHNQQFRDFIINYLTA